ncbi:MAG: hypothetical protein HQL28_06895 [Candidatus Omnitrophica bacterium]|nr:hypothetical protein [Candidatus Omnitrophota bacterium]
MLKGDARRDMILKTGGELLKIITDDFAQSLAEEGFNKLVMSAPFNFLNEIDKGFAYDNRITKKIELEFSLEGEEKIFFDIVMRA